MSAQKGLDALGGNNIDLSLDRFLQVDFQPGEIQKRAAHRHFHEEI